MSNKYQSEFKDYIPTDKHSPCWSKGKVCKHKSETIGRCRNDCKEYKQYQAILDVKHAKSGIETAIDAAIAKKIRVKYIPLP